LTSAAAFQCIARRELEFGNSQILERGTDQLIQALGERHGMRISRSTRVEKVVLRGQQIALEDAEGKIHVADHVVLALPLKPLIALAFLPRPPRMVSLWKAARKVAREFKVHAQIELAELEAGGISQHAMGLGFPRMTWTLPEMSSDGRVVLSATAVRQHLPLVQLARARGPKALDALLRARLPLFRTLQVPGSGTDLTADPLIGGAYTYVPAGTSLSPIPVSEDRLTLAGSDFSTHPGWMEGALESAERAVREILVS
jgi:monoamine oxidase